MPRLALQAVKSDWALLRFASRLRLKRDVVLAAVQAVSAEELEAIGFTL